MCHKVNEEGVKFGPELTQIGDKLSKEGIYRSILYPDEGVSFGYESTLVALKDGTESMGIIASETDANLVLNLPGGSSVAFTRDQIESKTKGENSLMPALANAMTTQELIDLVEFLSSLKK
jgi:putative heme-binding domain-containing protein